MEAVLDHLNTFQGGWQRPGEQVFQSKEQHEEKAGELHERAKQLRREEARKSRKCYRAVDHLHDDCSKADPKAPPKAATRTLIDNGDINRPHRDGNDKAAY